MKTIFKYTFALVLAFMCGLAFAAFTSGGEKWGREDINKHFTKQVWVDGAAHIDGAATLGSTLAVTGATTLTGGAAIGSGGTATTKILRGSITFTDASTTTCSCAITGLTSSCKLLVMPNSAFSGSVYIKSAVPGTGAAVVTFSGDPGTTVTMAYEAWTQ